MAGQDQPSPANVPGSRATTGPRPSQPDPVLAWSVPRNPAVQDPDDRQVRASGPPSPAPVFRKPMTAGHKAWRAFVSVLSWFLRLKETDAIYVNNPAYFVDKTLRDRPAGTGGLMSWARVWRLEGPVRRGKGTSALVLVHADGLAVYPSTGRRSMRLILTRVREVIIERGLEFLMFIIGAPIILAIEDKVGLLLRIVQVVVFAAVAVRLPAIVRWIIGRSPKARKRLDAYRERRLAKAEERDLEEARSLFEKAKENPGSFVIPWTTLTAARFELRAGLKQVMTYGPPSVEWTLAWQTRAGASGSAVISVPVRSTGYPELGFADLRLDAELRLTGPGALKDEIPALLGLPGMKAWLKGRGLTAAPFRER